MLRKLIYLSCFVFFTLSSFQYASAQSCPGDINQDGVVDIADFGLLSANYGNTCDESDEPEYPEGTVHSIPGGAEVVEVLNPSTGKTWMDRNLGASQQATAYNDEEAYGDLYQWGGFSDGHQCRDSETTSSLSSTTQPGQDDFITFSSSPFEWTVPPNSYLWQGLNILNNPCPSGFRIPTQAEWDQEIMTWEANEGSFNSVLKLPAGVQRAYYTGIITYEESFGNYWSSPVTESVNLNPVMTNSYEGV